MTFLSPFWLVIAGAASGFVVLLHLLARSRPREMLFPTTRFIPESRHSSRSLSRRPSDLLLLLLRLLVVVLVGLALARPVWTIGSGTAHIALLDRSRLAPPPDSAVTALLLTADVALGFDTAAFELDPSAIPGSSDAPGSLSAAIIAAVRSAPGLKSWGDSVRLTIISPFAREEWDPATLLLAAQWKGRIDLIQVPPRVPQVPSQRGALDPSDPLAATLAVLGNSGGFPASVVRSKLASEDSAVARSGAPVVFWPRNPSESGWRREPVDTAAGVSTGNTAVVAPFQREFLPPEGELLAVWADGRAAVTSMPLGRGCIRNVAIPLPAGDIPLRPSFLDFTRALLAPCNGWIEAEPVDAALLDSLRGQGSLLPTAAISPPQAAKTPANSWLLLLATALFGLEPFLRRKRS